MVSLAQVRGKIKRDGMGGLARAVLRRILPGRARGLDENQIIFDLFAGQVGTMVDVGAAVGSTLRPFAARGWSIHAFEPDTNNRVSLLAETAGLPNVTVSDHAVSETDGQTLTFYSSPESIGVSSLTAFTDKHVATGTVVTTRLDTYLAEHKIGSVDYLKVDAEGHDFFVLKSFPFQQIKPRAVLCEFEDSKTIPLGYRMSDMADFLTAQGYSVVISEWYPIEKYGIEHKWRRFVDYPTPLEDEKAWGNLIAFQDTGTLLADVIRASGRH